MNIFSKISNIKEFVVRHNGIGLILLITIVFGTMASNYESEHMKNTVASNTASSTANAANSKLNASHIASNTADISTNTADISTNAANIAALKKEVGATPPPATQTIIVHIPAILPKSLPPVPKQKVSLMQRLKNLFTL